MPKLFILIKRKGSKRLLGAIPAKSGATVSKLRSLIQRQKKAGFDAKIVSETKLKTILKRLIPTRSKRIMSKIRRKRKRRR